MRSLIVATAAALISVTGALGFEPEECSALLSFGIYDTHEVVSAEEKFKSLKSYYCKDKKASGGLDLSGVGVPLMAKGDYSSNVCSGNVSVEYQSYFYHSISREINENIVAGFNECLRTDRAGVSYTLQTQPDPSRFVLRFTFTRYGKEVSDTVSAIVEGATCRSPAFDGEIGDGERFTFEITSDVEVSCKRDPSHSVQVTTAATEITTKAVSLPAYSPPVIPDSFTFRRPAVQKRANAPESDDPLRPLDVCAAFKTGCGEGDKWGEPAATLWCFDVGLGPATHFRVQENTPPTRTISDRVDCNSVACDQIYTVTCSRQ